MPPLAHSPALGAKAPRWSARAAAVSPLPLAGGTTPAGLLPARSVPLWRRTVDPRSLAKRRWDSAMLVLVLYCTLIIPWNIGFTFDAAENACTAAVPADNCYPRHMARVDAVVDFIFWLDVGLTLRTALPARGGALVTSWRRLADAYGRGWAAADLVSIFPWDALVAAAAAARHAAPSPLALKLAKLPRLLRLRLVARALRRSGSVAKGEAAVAGPVLRLAQLVGAFLLLAHAGACAMWTASRWQVEHTPQCGIHALTGLRPMALRDHRRGVTYSAEADAAQAALCALRSPAGLVLPPDATWSLYCADLPTKYMAMAYYALTTLVTTGFGDIVPGTNVERCCAVAMQLAGCVSCAVVFGNVALLLEGWDRGGARLRRRVAQLAQLCAHHRVPPRLARAAAEHAAAAWRAQRGCDVAAALAALPPCLAPDVLLHLHGPALASSALFQHASLNLRKVLAARLTPQFFADGDVIMEHREASAAMFFVTAGTAAVTRRGVRCATLAAGDCFGELQLRGGGARAAARVVAEGRAGAAVLRLSRADLEEALADFPEEVPPLRTALAQRTAAARAARLAAAAPPKGAAAITAGDDESDSDGSDSDAEEPAGLGGSGALGGVDEDAPPGAELARRLWHVRVVASAQHRVVRRRVASAAAAYAALDKALDAALAACGALSVDAQALSQ